MNIILFGFKHSGKSTIGKHAAAILQKKFVDTDDLIEERFANQNNLSLPYWRIYEKYGEKFFRDLEKEVVKTLQEEENSIIATGGGAVLDQENAKLLSSLGEMIYIDVPKEQLKRRMFEGRIPLFISEGPMAFDRLHSQRKAFYEKLAKRRLFVTDVEEGVYHLLEEIRSIENGKQ